jgi:hypothetical protein
MDTATGARRRLAGLVRYETIRKISSTSGMIDRIPSSTNNFTGWPECHVFLHQRPSSSRIRREAAVETCAQEECI